METPLNCADTILSELREAKRSKAHTGPLHIGRSVDVMHHAKDLTAAFQQVPDNICQSTGLLGGSEDIQGVWGAYALPVRKIDHLFCT